MRTRVSQHNFLISSITSLILAIVAALPAHGQQIGPPGVVDPDTLTDREIQWALDALVDGLVAWQSDAGTWERQFPQWDMRHLNIHASGQTTLAVFALLSSGMSYQDARLRPAIDFLRSNKSDYTYVRSLRTHVWSQLPDRFSTLLERDARWLLNAYDYDSGSWNYTSSKPPLGYDNSLTQYGLLGLWEAAKRRVEIPDDLWQRVEQHYLSTQTPDGGWFYRPYVPPARASMTCAGLTCLFVTQDYLHADKYLDTRPRDPFPHDLAISRGLEWLNREFRVDIHPGAPDDESLEYYHYYLYSIERVGLASGLTRFGEHDWFREGAAALISRHCLPVYDNDTGAHIGYVTNPDFQATGVVEPPIVQLSFSIMFLAHGRVPIVVSKIRDRSIDWNARPRDMANLVNWVGQETEQRVSWQILDVDRPIDEWFAGPMVYLASPHHISWVPTDGGADQSQLDTNKVRDIKRYLELGGLLITNADGRDDGFSRSVRNLSALMFPNFTWRRLPKDHWVYTLSAPVENPPVLLGFTNGVRELIIHCPDADLGRALQANRPNADQDAFATLSNLYYYASERGQIRARLDTRDSLMQVDTPRPGDDAFPDPDTTTASVRIVRAIHGGNWNPEPAADEMLARRLLARRGIAVHTEDRALTDLPGPGAGTILFIRGTDDDISLSAAEKDGLRTYIKGGGFVFVETVGGRSAFGREIEKVIRAWYPETRFRTLTRHPIITGAGLTGARDCSTVSYRLYSFEAMGGRETRPRLRALASDGERANVFVSRQDFSHALLGQPCWGINGYVTDDAVDILGNLLSFVVNPTLP